VGKTETSASSFVTHLYNAHNAGDDVRMLYDLLSVAGVTEEQLQEHSFLVTNAPLVMHDLVTTEYNF
jgi:hypothetical protein